jgi:hypothetical protein
VARPAKPSPREYSRIARLHAATVDRVTIRGSAVRLKALYEQALDELARDSRRYFTRAQWTESFTAHQHRIVLAQLRAGVRQLSIRMGQDVTAHARDAAAEGVATTLANIRRLEAHYGGTTPVLSVEEAAQFAGAGVPGRATSLLRDATGHGLLPDRVQTSMARYGAHLVGAFEQELALSMLRQETLGDTITRIQTRGGLEWWQAERIARTETAWALNQGSADAVAYAASDEMPDMLLRWNEHVDDVTGAPYDNRVAPDSMAMHGQAVRPGEQFVMPIDERVAAVRWGMKYSFPPNRPMDRAVVGAWRPHWGISAWKWEGGTRVPVMGE